MKTYRIKKIYADRLSGLHGLLITPTECKYYADINVFDYQTTLYFGFHNRLTRLPKNCDHRLVHAVLEQIQIDKSTPEQVERLKEYLKLAKQKDNNAETKSDLKQSIKEIFLGFLITAAGVGGGFGLMLLVAILSPANAFWVALCLVFATGVATWGFLKLSIGCIKFGIELFSICSQKNTGQLPVLENELRSNYFQSLLPPPSYFEVMKNNKAFPSVANWYAEPPTYQQVIENSTALAAYNPTPESHTMPGPSAYFMHPYTFFASSSHHVINDNLSPPAYHGHYFDKTTMAR